MNKVLKGSVVEKNVICKSPIKKANLQKRNSMISLSFQSILMTLPPPQLPKVLPTKKLTVSNAVNRKIPTTVNRRKT